MRACRIAGRPAGLWQIMNCGFVFLCVTAKRCCTRCELSKQALYISLVCCFFEGGIIPPKKETDSKSYQYSIIRLNILFPIGRSSPLWVLYLCGLEICKFFGSILSKNERKIVSKTVCRLNLQISKTVRTFICTQ